MIKKWFGNLVSVVTLIFFLQYFDVETAAEHIKSFNMTVFLLSMFVILLGVVVKAYRWVWINNHHFTLSKSFKAYVMSIVLNALLPLRAGDVYRVSVFNGLFKTKIAFLIARMVREKLFDLMTVLMIFHIALMFVESRIAHDLDIYYSETILPNSNYVCTKGLFLPSYITLTNEEILYICRIIKIILK